MEKLIIQLAQAIHGVFPAVLIETGEQGMHAPSWDDLTPALKELTIDAARAAFAVMSPSQVLKETTDEVP